MLKHEILQADGILLVEPQSALSAEDFHAVSAEVNAYLENHADLRGVLIHARSFPGWDSVAALMEHLHFLREIHTKVERVAVVSDAAAASIAPAIAKHFVKAEFRHFPYAEYAAALEWLKTA
jgi:hypothetical protein